MLYDIACQIHLSAAKHGLFDRYLGRLHFAVSVFHAFGHDWPCQLIYHPRKCVGFGLTDGEGCERFWYSISKLIAYLRVAGYHLRQYTLNAQIVFATKDWIANAAAWLSRKASRLEAKRAEAQLLLEEAGDVGADEPYVRQQWAAQVEAQTRAAARQDKDLGRKEVEKGLELYDALAEARNIRDDLREQARGPLDLEQKAELRSAEATYAAAKARYERKLSQLGVGSRTRLESLTKSKILHRRANALVLLRRVQVGIIKRKMEVERVVRSHRNKHGENQLRKHIKTGAERREGTVKTIISKYNRACRELSKLIRREKTRKGHCPVRPLAELPKTGVWDLDIDNACWDDLRFDGEDADEAPPWMRDDNVRKAIRAQLLLDRCSEEDARLQHERENITQWLEDEWRALTSALKKGIGFPG
ncbi:hypothetical protein BD626DRAFT_406075 [Schizophyllum amplum]|uniref:Uncharacterized protein n=1 Tax=Schizophyllum amplum TaxID=97359 RepID=A0A550C8R6_9AGAR|nr:hypothetical protein BD626DRAFT_406075 [Auriculariopsis ampla]